MILIKREQQNKQELLTIQVEQAEWSAALEQAYRENFALLPVEGCEPGKATRQQLEEAYGADALYQEAVNLTYPIALVEAVRRENLTVAAAPALEIQSIGPEGYVFLARIDPYPQVQLGQYKYLPVTVEKVELTDIDMEAAMAAYCQQNPHVEHPDRSAMGDQVVIDFEGFVDGVAFPGGKGEGYPLTLGSGEFIPGFEEQVAGIRPGEERDITVTFPEDYTPALSGKTAVFHVKAHQVSRYSPLELTEEYAVQTGFENLSQLRQKILADALARKEQAAQAGLADTLIGQVTREMQVEIPESMLESQLNGLMQEMENQLAQQGFSMDNYLEAAGLTRDDLRQQARQNAEQSVRFELAMTEIARLEGIIITDEEVSRKYEEMAPLYQMTPEQMRKALPPERLAHDLRLARARAIVINTAKRITD